MEGRGQVWGSRRVHWASFCLLYCCFMFYCRNGPLGCLDRESVVIFIHYSSLIITQHHHRMSALLFIVECVCELLVARVFLCVCKCARARTRVRIRSVGIIVSSLPC